MTSNNKTTTDDRFKRVVELTIQTIEKRIDSEIGFTDDQKLIQLLNEESIRSKMKPCLRNYVINQLDSNECVKEIKKLVSCSKMYDRDLDWSINDLIYNIYQHYDAAYNMHLASEFGMEFFIYQGGLIDDSRDFCVAHNNKVFTKDEAEGWYKWSPSKGVYPPGYKLKSESEFEIPAYINYYGYQPLIDRGGYNCRHMLGWISNELAFDLRPDLKPK